MNIFHSVAELAGNTPLLELCRYEHKHGLNARILAKLEYPMNEASVDYAASRFRTVYDRYLAGSNRVYVSLIPDKTAYLDDIPKLDHTAFAERLRKQRGTFHRDPGHSGQTGRKRRWFCCFPGPEFPGR